MLAGPEARLGRSSQAVFGCWRCWGADVPGASRILEVFLKGFDVGGCQYNDPFLGP